MASLTRATTTTPLVLAGRRRAVAQIGLRQQEEQRALAMIFRRRPGALETVGKDLAGLVAHAPSPAEPLAPGEDHFEHADELGPLLPCRSRRRTNLLRPSPFDGGPTYNAAGWKENKIDDRKSVSSTGRGERARRQE
ncbi:hypothetical protein D6B98_16100 [Bradyrhizobium sp. LVM 105]|uniref:Uncharacterized protein n=1 Tax=Bradyrhizobium frederickii TaxID=2560054 RepID=A0A4Y9LC62_9BRAD|nr:hypothetical protein D6B98_16100 [Bradyrhizobium sp. LVM 105]TFV39553.1 hypothetical protein E4K66_13530 [Bradyrhizobium frederickii]